MSGGCPKPVELSVAVLKRHTRQPRFRAPTSIFTGRRQALLSAESTHHTSDRLRLWIGLRLHDRDVALCAGGL